MNVPDKSLKFGGREESHLLLELMSMLRMFLSNHVLPNPNDMTMNILKEESKAKIETLVARLDELLENENEMLDILWGMEMR